MKPWSALIVLVLLAQRAPATQAREASASILLIGGIEVTLGDSQEAVLRELGAIYEIRHLDDAAGTWVVVKRGGPPFDALGSLAFAERRLVFASRTWGPDPEDQSASALATALYRAVRTLPPELGRQCVVTTDGSSRTVHLTLMRCGSRRLSLIGSTDRNVAASVSEAIGVER